VLWQRDCSTPASAIISHPDASEPSLTGKLLIRGGAVQSAGELKPFYARRRTRSGLMETEREHRISVSSRGNETHREEVLFRLPRVRGATGISARSDLG